MLAIIATGWDFLRMKWKGKRFAPTGNLGGSLKKLLIVSVSAEVFCGSCEKLLCKSWCRHVCRLLSESVECAWKLFRPPCCRLNSLLGFSEERTRAKRKWRSWLSFKDPGMAFRKLSKYLRCQGNGTSANHLGREMDSRPNCKIQRPRKQWPKIWAIRLRQFFCLFRRPESFLFWKGYF